MILVTGYSGSGKSHSLGSLPPAETLLVKSTSKMAIPMKGFKKHYQALSDDWSEGNVIYIQEPYAKQPDGAFVSKISNIFLLARQRKFKYVVFDDFQYMLLNLEQQFRQAATDKDTRAIYVRVKAFITDAFSQANLAEQFDVETIFIWQKHRSKEELVIPGEYYNEVVVPQGYFDIVLQAEVTLQDEHYFKTNGFGICKSPKGMFEPKEPNELATILAKIRKYEEEE